jgi:hypothetical protein
MVLGWIFSHPIKTQIPCGDNPVAAAGRTEQQIVLSLFDLFKEFEQHGGTISADTRSELERPDDQRLKTGIGYPGEQIEHITFAGFLGSGTDMARFDTIVRASEIGMAYIDVATVSLHGVGQNRFDLRRQWRRLKSLGAVSDQAPFSGQVDGQCGNDPVRPLIGFQVSFKVRHPVRLFENSIGPLGLGQIRSILID